jgi:hypothetical protein
MLKHQLLIDSPVVFKGNFRKANVGDRRQRHHHRHLRQLGESAGASSSVFVDSYGTGKRKIPTRRSSRSRMAHREEQDPDKEILKIVKEKFNFRPGMITDNLDR